MNGTRNRTFLCGLCAFCVPWLLAVFSAAHVDANPKNPEQSSTARTSAPSDGCLTCHRDAKDPHPVQQSLTCVDCHGGNGTATTKQDAHPTPAVPAAWRTSANPASSFTLLNHERYEWIRFVNPSDLRVAAV